MTEVDRLGVYVGGAGVGGRLNSAWTSGDPCPSCGTKLIPTSMCPKESGQVALHQRS